MLVCTNCGVHLELTLTAAPTPGNAVAAIDDSAGHVRLKAEPSVPDGQAGSVAAWGSKTVDFRIGDQRFSINRQDVIDTATSKTFRTARDHITFIAELKTGDGETYNSAWFRPTRELLLSTLDRIYGKDSSRDEKVNSIRAGEILLKLAFRVTNKRGEIFEIDKVVPPQQFES